jgi:hypothetical protein
MQCNIYASGCYATCVLHGYSSRNTTHTVLQKAEGLAIKYNSPAEYCDHKQKVSNETNLHLKSGKSSTISQLDGS